MDAVLKNLNKQELLYLKENSVVNGRNQKIGYFDNEFLCNLNEQKLGFYMGNGLFNFQKQQIGKVENSSLINLNGQSIMTIEGKTEEDRAKISLAFFFFLQ